MSEDYRNQNPMVEKVYEVKMGVRKKRSRPTEWMVETFRVFEKSEEGAKLRALIKAAQAYPIDEGWEYDNKNATVEEISMAQIERELEEHRNRIAKEGEKRLEEMLAELERNGIYLRRP